MQSQLEHRCGVGSCCIRQMVTPGGTVCTSQRNGGHRWPPAGHLGWTGMSIDEHASAALTSPRVCQTQEAHSLMCTFKYSTRFAHGNAACCVRRGAAMTLEQPSSAPQRHRLSHQVRGNALPGVARLHSSKRGEGAAEAPTFRPGRFSNNIPCRAPSFDFLSTTILLEAASHADAEARQAVNSTYTALESGTQCSGDGGGGGEDGGGRRLAGALPAPPGGQCSVSAPG